VPNDTVYGPTSALIVNFTTSEAGSPLFIAGILRVCLVPAILVAKEHEFVWAIHHTIFFFCYGLDDGLKTVASGDCQVPNAVGCANKFITTPVTGVGMLVSCLGFSCHLG